MPVPQFLARPEDALAPGAAPPLPPAVADLSGLPGIPPAQPGRTMTTSSQAPTITTTVMSPEAKASLGQLAGHQEDAVAAADREQAAKAKAQDIEATGAQMDADTARYYEIERQRAAAEREEQKKSLAAATEARLRERKAKAHPTSYWDDKGKPAQIVAAFLVGLKSLSNSMAGHPGAANTAWEMFQNAEAQDRQGKLDEFTRSKEYHEIAQHSEAAAYAAFDKRMQELREEEAVKRKVIVNQVGAITKRLGIPAAQAEYEKLSAMSQAKDAQERAKDFEHYDRVISGGHTTTTNTTTIKAEGGPGGAGGMGAGGRAQGKMIGLAMTGTQMKDDLDTLDAGITKGLAFTQDERAKVQFDEARVKSAEHNPTVMGALVTEGMRRIGAAPRNAYENLPEEKQAMAQSARLLAEKVSADLSGNEKGQQQLLQNLDALAPGISQAASRDRLEKLRTVAYVGLALSGQYGPVAQQAAVAAKARGADVAELAAIGAEIRAQAHGGGAKAESTPGPPPSSAGGKNKPVVRTREKDGKRYVDYGDGWRVLEGGGQ